MGLAVATGPLILRARSATELHALPPLWRRAAIHVPAVAGPIISSSDPSRVRELCSPPAPATP